MAEPVLRAAPLNPDALPSPRGGPAVTLCAPMTRFIFRGDGAAARVCGEAFGVSPSQEVCRAAVAGARAALWLGPDEWLLLAPEAEGAKRRETLDFALKGLPHSLTDVSHRQTALEISGARAAALLNAHCMLDLDAAAFPAGMCTRTLFGKAEIVLWRKTADLLHIEV